MGQYFFTIDSLIIGQKSISYQPTYQLSAIFIYLLIPPFRLPLKHYQQSFQKK